MNIAQRRPLSLLHTTLLTGCVLSLASLAHAQHYVQHNLVSDLSTEGADHVDTHLANPWGLARSSGSPWWVSNNHTGTSTLYNGLGEAQPPPPIGPLVVTITPAEGSTEGGVPTGTVFNGTNDFELPTGGPARFIFVAEDGTISGWNGGTKTTVVSTKDGSVYKGVAIATVRDHHFLFVANFSKKRIDVFDSRFHLVHLGDDDDQDAPGDRDSQGHGHRPFEDKHIPRSFSPFNIQNIGDNLYVAYAKLDPATNDEVAGPGLGFVDVFSSRGRLLRRLEHGDWLNAPWGLVLASGDFGTFTHHILVGQFGSGQIAAYNAATGRFVGLVQTPGTDDPLSIEGLWALSFGNGGNAGPATTLFFTAGIDDEEHGLFGTLLPVPEEKLLGNGQ
jgi:uncharacterized protein (TIGR03118 family)